MKNLRAKLLRFFCEEQGGKNVINRGKTLAIACALLLVGLSFEILPVIWKNDLPQGGIRKSDIPLVKDGAGEIQEQQIATANSQSIGGVTDHAPQQRRPIAHGKPIRYKARQVLLPDAAQERIPSGANFVGKLLTSIDTRSPQLVSVTLPYGGRHRSGGGSLPPDTILVGQVSYSGQSERVFMTFSRAILPDGQELAIRAQALSSKDYRAGIIGEYHSNKGDQMAASLGLTMISGMSEVMVEKEGLGNSYETTPKATLKNGFYNGLAKVTETEATNQATRLAQTPNYVTLESGSDLIISLGESMGTVNERQQQE